MTTQVVLATAPAMPKPDPESHLLVDSLAALGIEASLREWDAPTDWSEPALVVSRTPWDYFDRPSEFFAWAREVAAATRLENPLEVLEWNGHKSYLLDLERAGVPVVPTVLVQRGAPERERAAALERFGEVVIKPAISGGALDTIRTASGAEGAGEHLARLTAAGEALVQPFLEEVQGGEVSLVYFDGILSHALRKIPRAGDFRVQEVHGGRLEGHDPTAAELSVAERALAAAPAATAYARIDLLETGDGPLLMEAELIEPELFLPRAPGAADRFAECLASRLARA